MTATTSRLHGKTIIVTGSTKGLGEAMARRFADDGATVVVSGRSEDKGAVIEAELRAEGVQALYVRADMADESSVRALIDRTVAEYGRIDGLVNNAMPMDQIGADERAVADMDSGAFEDILKVGLFGGVWACKCAIPVMLDGGGGSIVNITSIAAVAGIPKLPGYTACKGAMAALTRQMAVDYGAQNIRVNSMVPGFLLTTDLAAAVEAHPVAGPAIQEGQLTRWGHFDDISNMASYLLSDESGFVTGTEFRIDGGWTSNARIPDLVSMVFAPMVAGRQSPTTD